MMRLSHLFIFTTAAFVGNCRQKITKLYVKEGVSIFIPCFYEEWLTDKVKYLSFCNETCSTDCRRLVGTDKPTESNQYSIFDNKLQQIFSVTIKNLTHGGRFLCGVAPESGDVQYEVQVHITSGTPDLYVDQQDVTVVLGESVTVLCYYNDEKAFEWCKVGSTCISTSGYLNNVRVKIKSNAHNFANVTMSGLTKENSGWYFCQNDGFQMPVNITVLDKATPAPPTTTHKTTATHLSTAGPTVCTNPTSTGLSTNSSTAVTENHHLHQHNSTLVIAIATTLALLVCFIVGGVAAWKIKSRKSIPSASDEAETVKDPDVLYSDIIIHNQRASKSKKMKPPEVNVIYSTIVTQDVTQTTGPAEGTVIYSTVSK